MSLVETKKITSSKYLVARGLLGRDQPIYCAGMREIASWDILYAGDEGYRRAGQYREEG
jgi:hypothetical protein